jgi:hypothetical protein
MTCQRQDGALIWLQIYEDFHKLASFSARIYLVNVKLCYTAADIIISEIPKVFLLFAENLQ